MSRFGITKDGFNRKGYLDIISDMNNLAKELFGEDIVLSERNPLAMSWQNLAWEVAGLWEVAEDTYHSPFVDTAEDISLDGVGKYITASRKAAQKSRGIITIEGNEDTIIPKGYRISTEHTGIMVEVLDKTTIDATNKANINIRAVIPGIAGNLPSYSLVKAVNPIAGITKIYNKEPTTDGTETEGDRDFRERYYRSASLGGSSTRESVESALLDMPEVVDAFVVENDTMEWVDDVAPKSLAPYVLGGNDDDVGKTILLSKAGGIRSYGDTEIEVEDSKEIKHIIGFTRPNVMDLYIRMNITKGLGYLGDDVIRRSILNYIGGQDNDGINYKGLKLGEDVVISKLMSTATCLQGVDDVSVEVSLDGIEYTTVNMSINKKEIARTDFDKVEIIHVK